MTSTIQKWGNSQGIRISKHLLDALQWSEGEKIELFVRDDHIVIQRVVPQKKAAIDELFEGYEGEYQPEETEPV